LNFENLIFSSHAIRQMFFRRISDREVRQAIAYGEIIEQSLEDIPFPSYLILDFVDGRAIHVVVSYDESTRTAYVVTAYIPDRELWTNNFRKRR
jgi:hypothetical protein